MQSPGTTLCGTTRRAGATDVVSERLPSVDWWVHRLVALAVDIEQDSDFWVAELQNTENGFQNAHSICGGHLLG